MQVCCQERFECWYVAHERCIFIALNMISDIASTCTFAKRLSIQMGAWCTCTAPKHLVFVIVRYVNWSIEMIMDGSHTDVETNSYSECDVLSQTELFMALSLAALWY